MTSSERAIKPAARHAADADLASGSASAPDTAASGDSTPDTTQQAGLVTGPPDDIQELRQEIEQTREELGETVQQLAAKTDVKARAQHKAAELTQKVKATASQAQTQSAASAGNVLSGLVKAAKPAWEATREPVQQTVSKGASTARQRRTPLLAAAATLVAGYLAIRWWRRR